jgi:hypothetical protein
MLACSRDYSSTPREVDHIIKRKLEVSSTATGQNLMASHDLEAGTKVCRSFLKAEPSRGKLPAGVKLAERFDIDVRVCGRGCAIIALSLSHLVPLRGLG